MNALVNLWLWLYTAAAPQAPRDRRREELASHLFEARSVEVTGGSLFVEALRGGLNDLRWCGDERRRAGWAPIMFAPLGSTVIAGFSMVTTYLIGLDRSLHLPGRIWLPRLAALVLLVSFVDSGRRRGRGKRTGAGLPICP